MKLSPGILPYSEPRGKIITFSILDLLLMMLVVALNMGITLIRMNKTKRKSKMKRLGSILDLEVLEAILKMNNS